MRDEVAEVDAGAQPPQRGFVGLALDLYPVGLGQFHFRLADGVLKLPVVGEYYQTFAVGVEPARRVDVRDRYEVLERALACARTELAKNAAGFVEEENPRHGLGPQKTGPAGFSDARAR